MAKVKNSFLKSKMNKDLDARLLPQGEYREAVNAQISKSEGSQVGNLENSLGNAAIQNYQTLTQSSNIKCIGSFADEINLPRQNQFPALIYANPDSKKALPPDCDFLAHALLDVVDSAQIIACALGFQAPLQAQLDRLCR